jgi:N6-adenosine-specific RNA methylase IME4
VGHQRPCAAAVRAPAVDAPGDAALPAPLSPVICLTPCCLQRGFTVVAQLCWYKVTCSGRPVCPLDSPHKKPFELAYIARRVPPASAAATDALLPVVHFSCPPSCHSRKPPLEAILPFVCRDIGIDIDASAPYCWTELFGRECRRGGFVVGNQAVALNRRDAWVRPQ